MKRTLRDQIIDQIRADIIAGRLRPGEIIRDQDLARRYATSGSPVREAIILLAGEGLVEMPSVRVKRVTPIDKQMSRHFLEVTRVLSRHAISVGLPRLTKDDVASIEKNQKAREAARTPEERELLGRLLWSGMDLLFVRTANPVLQKMRTDVSPWMLRLLMLIPMELEVQHRHLCDLEEALRSQDVARALRVYEDFADEYGRHIEKLPDY